jgi:hypothetical protein
MAPRYITVPVPGRNGIDVRVISQHPDDDKLRRQLYRTEAVWDWCDAQVRALGGYTKPLPDGDTVWMPPTVDASKLEAAADALATVKIKRDEACRELFKLVLGDKLSGTDIEEVLRQCNSGTIVSVFEAAKGIDRAAVWKEITAASASPAPSSTEPTSSSTPTPL